MPREQKIKRIEEMNLKQLAEKVKDLPDNLKFYPKWMMGFEEDFDSKTDRECLEILRLELHELQFFTQKSCEAYNSLKDIILEAKVE